MMTGNQSSVPSGSGTPNDNAMIALFQQFLQNQAQLFAAQANKRQLPLVDKLKRQEQWPTWRDKLIHMFRRHDLERYILTAVPEPEDPVAQARWKEDRADVDYYLQMVVDDKHLSLIQGMGWKPSDGDPKKTWDFLVECFEGGTADGLLVLHREFVNIRREAFASMEAYQTRVNFLKSRLETTGSPFALPEAGYTWMALSGIDRTYQDLYNRSVIALNDNKLSWGDLMREFARIASNEKAQPALITVSVDNNDKKKDHDKQKGPKPCSICQRKLLANSRHCNGCDNHVNKNSKTCWWCEPDKATDDWPHKAKAMQLKAERQQSTTGPLRQQSGVANPATTTTSSNATLKKVLFTTSLANLPASEWSFQ
jgi:hypothetical protein